MTLGLSVGPFKNMTERASASRPFWPKDGHALTRTISRTSSGRISERRQKDEDPAAERSAQAHAAESESADRQAGPSSRHRQEEETRATQAGLHQRGTGRIDRSLGVVRLPLWTAFDAGTAKGSRAAASSQGTGLQRCGG